MKKHILIIILLIPILLAVGLFSTMNVNHYGHKIPRTIMDINAIGTALDLFKLDNSSYPNEQDGLGVLVDNIEPFIYKNWFGPYLKKVPEDSWGNEYIYRRAESSAFFMLYSSGPNGIDDQGLHDDLTTDQKKYDCKLFNNCKSFMHKYGIWSLPIAALLLLYVLGYLVVYIIKHVVSRIKKR